MSEWEEKLGDAFVILMALITLFLGVVNIYCLYTSNYPIAVKILGISVFSVLVFLMALSLYYNIFEKGDEDCE